MENIYIYMLVALAFLAVADLVVGVSNDAVNFLNSAIGSKAVSFKTIMIIASLGVAVGAMTSRVCSYSNYVFYIDKGHQKCHFYGC